jgi:xanthine dehydrogenase accessory factor
MLPSVLRSSAGYIGMIGSRRKIREVYDRLGREQGIDPQSFERIHAPIGLEIGSESPAEIAVAIAAEMIKVAGEAKSGD